MNDTRIISLAQQKGGSGKTTLAAHIAVALDIKGVKVALVDLDSQGHLTKWVALRAQDKKITCVHTSVWKLQDELAVLKEHADVILIDTPPHNPMDALSAMKFSDLVLIPVQPSPLDVWGTEATIELADKERIPHRLVWNRVLGERTKLPYLPTMHNMLSVHVPNHVEFASCMAEGKTIMESDSSCIGSIALDTLGSELVGLLYPVTERLAVS